MKPRSMVLLCGLLAAGVSHAGDPNDVGRPAPVSASLASTPTADGGWTRTSMPVAPVESLPLSELALRQPPAPATEEPPRLVPNREEESALPEGPKHPSQGVFVEQRAQGAGQAPGLGALGFQGISAGGIAPPDSDGNIGPNHYVQWVNLKLAVYDKATGAQAPGFPILGKTLFASLGGVCASHNDGDPVVLYDSLADRWQISQFVVQATEDPASNSHQCIAVSKTPDPTGAWYLYDFPTVFGAPSDFIDYEKLATWTDAYYMSGRDFCSAGTLCTTGLYGVIYAFERPKMLQGLPARLVAYANTSNVGTAPLITDIDGLTPPPAGRPAHVFWAKTTTTLGVTTFATTWGATPSITATPKPDISVALYGSVSCTSNGTANRRCVPQPTPATDPNDQLDAISSRLMFRAAYRNHGGTESVLLSHSVAGTSPVKAAVRWYEVQLQTGTPTLYQSGTFAPDNTNRWMGSIAMDASGNIAVGYSRSARAAAGPPVVPAVIPELSVAGRLAGDALGTMTGDTVLKAGVGVQTGTGNRWGDYSTMNVDPRDGCTFWYQGEYLPSNGSFNWSTWIGTSTYAPADCSPETFGKLSGNVTYAETGNPVVGALVTAGAFSGGAGATGAYELTARPGPYTASVATRTGCTTVVPAAPSVTITNGGTATQSFTVDGTDVLALGTPTLDDSNGNGNGVINRDECFRLTIPLRNGGCHSASAVSVTVSSATAGVTVKTGTSAYPNVAVGATQSNSVPFELATSPTFVCGTPIVVNVGINSASGFSSTAITLPTCATAQTFSGDIAATDVSQNPRQFRDGVSSTCTPKTCPSTSGTGPYYYDVYTFTNTFTAPVCLTVAASVTGTCMGATSGNVFFAAYSPTFTGNGSCTNFLGDIGGNPSPSGSFQITLAAGQQFELVATETTASATCSGYSGSITGFIDDTGGGRPAALAAGGGTICAGQSVALGGSGGTSCSWTPTTGLDNPYSCAPNASPITTTTYNLTVTAAGGCTSGNVAQATVTVTPDSTAPVVTPPAALVVDQTVCCGVFGGVTPATSTALNTFVTAGTATDNCDPAPAHLAAQKGGSDITGSTCFEAGISTVTFRFRDAAGNNGTATATARVRMFGDLNEDAVLDPSDMVILRAYFNFAITPGTAPFTAPIGMADVTHDATVDPSDLVVMRAYMNFAVSCLAP